MDIIIATTSILISIHCNNGKSLRENEHDKRASLSLEHSKILLRSRLQSIKHTLLSLPFACVRQLKWLYEGERERSFTILLPVWPLTAS